MLSFNVDMHMHFDLYKNKDAVVDYIEKQRIYTMAVTNLPEIYKKNTDKYSNCKYFRLALGFHPELVAEYENQIAVFEKLVDTTRYIGEVGLDFSCADGENKQKQVSVFKQIVQCCSGKNKIMSIHSRKAVSKVIECLDGYAGKVILHWYSGNINDLNTAIERGYFFSINHQMISSYNGRNIIRNIPVSRILLESDAPFTSGLKNKYSLEFNNIIYDYLANEYNQSLQIMYRRIKANLKDLIT